MQQYPNKTKEKQLEKEFKVFREWSFTVSYSTKLDYDNLKLSGPFWDWPKQASPQKKQLNPIMLFTILNF